MSDLDVDPTASPAPPTKPKRGMRRLVTVLAALSLAAMGTTASAAVPAFQPGGHTVTSGPISITVPVAATFQRGSITSMFDNCGFGLPYIWTKAEVGFSWQASSTAGSITGYDVWALTGAGNFLVDHQTASSIANQRIDNYQGDCGGGSLEQYAWHIVAHDSAGHAVTSANIDSFLDVTRFDNTSAESVQGTWTYTGPWAVRNCTCADGHRQTYTTARNATASFTITPSKAGYHVGLMMAEGPGRGSLKVYLDGVLKGTINTHVGVNINRVLTWDSGALTAATHTILLVNLATAGHPQIDLNAATISW